MHSSRGQALRRILPLSAHLCSLASPSVATLFAPLPGSGSQPLKRSNQMARNCGRLNQTKLRPLLMACRGMAAASSHGKRCPHSRCVAASAISAFAAVPAPYPVQMSASCPGRFHPCIGYRLRCRSPGLPGLRSAFRAPLSR